MIIVIEISDDLISRSLQNEGYLSQEIDKEARESTAIDFAAKIIEDFSDNNGGQVTIKLFL